MEIENEGASRAAGTLLVSALACLLLFTATLSLPRVDRHLLGSDGLKYYAILRSVVFDRDFDFTNDYVLLNTWIRKSTPSGLPGNVFAIGPAILWVPFFAAAHLVSLFLNSLGLAVPLDGVSYIYEYGVCVGTILYASLGFVLAFRVTTRLTAVSPACLAVLGFWWASQATYYLLAEPSMSHGLTIFSTSLFLYVWYPPDARRSPADCLRLGFVTGLVALVRWQDGLIVLVPLTELGYWYARGQLRLPQLLTRLLALSGSAMVAFLPQCVMWADLYGSPLTIPQGRDLFVWSSPQIVSTLFSTRHGLISWHPIFLIALFGLPQLWRRSRALAGSILFMFLAQLYINASVTRWWADDAFGGRRFTGLIPLFVLPLACLIDGIRREPQRRAIAILLGILVVWNGLCLIQYRAGWVSRDAALTLREMTVDRLLLPVDIIRRAAK